MSDSKTKEYTFGNAPRVYDCRHRVRHRLRQYLTFPYIAFWKQRRQFILSLSNQRFWRRASRRCCSMIPIGSPLQIVLRPSLSAASDDGLRRSASQNVMTNIVICIYYAVKYRLDGKRYHNIRWHTPLTVPDPQGFFFTTSCKWPPWLPWVSILSTKSARSLGRRVGFTAAINGAGRAKARERASSFFMPPCSRWCFWLWYAFPLTPAGAAKAALTHWLRQTGRNSPIQSLGGGIRADFLFASIWFGIRLPFSYLKKNRLGGTEQVVGFTNAALNCSRASACLPIGLWRSRAVGGQRGCLRQHRFGVYRLSDHYQPGTDGLADRHIVFGSLVFIGVTSMISILEVIVAAIQDKLNIGRVNATLLVCIPIGIVSTQLFGTATGITVWTWWTIRHTYGMRCHQHCISGTPPESTAGYRNYASTSIRIVLHPHRRSASTVTVRCYRHDARL